MIFPLIMEQFLVMLVGIALAMCLEWLSRAVIFWIRFQKGKWKTLHVI